MKRIILALALLLAAFAAQAAAFKDAAKEVHSRTLTNGMKVIVWPDNDIPNAAMYIFYKAGSRNERPGITGLAHFFEHMMFKGGKRYPLGAFDRVMEDNGGYNNASTTSDLTTYQNWFPVSAIELIFELEADRIRDLTFDPQLIESERGVVYSERRSSVDNNNFGLLFEQVGSTAFIAHPYQFPTIGWPSDIESWSVDDLKSFFRTYYAPNNAVMVVVGAVRPAQVFALAEKYIQPIPAQPPPDPIRTKEPEQLGERRVTINKEAQTPVLQIAYKIGSATDPDREALELLEAVLTNGDSSRLHRRLVEEEQVAISVGSFLEKGFDPSLGWFYFSLPADGNLQRLESLFDSEIDKVIREGVTDAELRKARNIELAELWRSLATIDGKAGELGTYEVFYGDYKRMFDEPARFEAVTKEDIKRVAEKYLQRNRRTVGTLIPTPEAASAGGSR